MGDQNVSYYRFTPETYKTLVRNTTSRIDPAIDIPPGDDGVLKVLIKAVDVRRAVGAKQAEEVFYPQLFESDAGKQLVEATKQMVAYARRIHMYAELDMPYENQGRDAEVANTAFLEALRGLKKTELRTAEPWISENMCLDAMKEACVMTTHAQGFARKVGAKALDEAAKAGAGAVR